MKVKENLLFSFFLIELIHYRLVNIPMPAMFGDDTVPEWIHESSIVRDAREDSRTF